MLVRLFELVLNRLILIFFADKRQQKLTSMILNNNLTFIDNAFPVCAIQIGFTSIFLELIFALSYRTDGVKTKFIAVDTSLDSKY